MTKLVLKPNMVNFLKTIIKPEYLKETIDDILNSWKENLATENVDYFYYYIDAYGTKHGVNVKVMLAESYFESE